MTGWKAVAAEVDAELLERVRGRLAEQGDGPIAGAGSGDHAN